MGLADGQTAAMVGSSVKQMTGGWGLIPRAVTIARGVCADGTGTDALDRLGGWPLGVGMSLAGDLGRR